MTNLCKLGVKQRKNLITFVKTVRIFIRMVSWIYAVSSRKENKDVRWKLRKNDMTDLCKLGVKY